MNSRVNSARVNVAGSDRLLPASAKSVGAPDPAEMIEVTVRVRPRAPLAPGAALQGREIMTREAFAETHGASEDDLSAVETFGSAYGLTVVERSAERRLVTFSGPLEDVASAFGVTLELYEMGGATFRGRQGNVSVPAELANIVRGVFGLDDRAQARAQFRILESTVESAPGIAFPHFPGAAFTPPELAGLYRFPQGVDGGGQTVAIIELGGGYRQADLKAYFQGLGLPTPQVSAVGVSGGRNAPTGDSSGADGEVLLDIEVVGGVAPGARIVVYFAPNTDAGFLNAVLRAAHDRERAPGVISISWGAPEAAWTGQALQNMNGAFEEAAALGVTVFCAAGDDGSDDRGQNNRANTDFPASSPFVTGCGGTRLTAREGEIAGEVVWNNGKGRGAGGGGVSDVFGVPDYQAQIGVPPSVNEGGRVGRGVPDVSGVADPETGYKVRVDGQDLVIGGTSAVAPLWAGLTARLNQALGRPVGFLNPKLYPLSGVLRDITEGSNGGYTARAGWDACTGLGSPDGERLLGALGGAEGVGNQD